MALSDWPHPPPRNPISQVRSQVQPTSPTAWPTSHRPAAPAAVAERGAPACSPAAATSRSRCRFPAPAASAATTQTGKPYLWGGNGPDAWDCSGLVQWAFRTVGISLPRTSQEMARDTGGMLVPLSALQPGDVITMNTYDIAGHVGIYAGNGMVFNAYGSGVPTGLRPLSDFTIHNIRRFF